MNQRFLIALIILAGIGSIGSVLAYSGTISAGQGNFNNVLITGTCTGCGGDGSFTTYSLVLNKTAGTSSGDGSLSFTANDGSLIGVDTGGNIIDMKLDGTQVSNDQNLIATEAYDSNSIMKQSSQGVYKVVQYGNSTVSIFKNNAVIQHIAIDTTHSFFNGKQGISISPDGKYIGLFGKDFNGVVDHIQIWQGS